MKLDDYGLFFEIEKTPFRNDIVLSMPLTRKNWDRAKEIDLVPSARVFIMFCGYDIASEEEFYLTAYSEIILMLEQGLYESAPRMGYKELVLKAIERVK